MTEDNLLSPHCKKQADIHCNLLFQEIFQEDHDTNHSKY